MSTDIKMTRTSLVTFTALLFSFLISACSQDQASKTATQKPVLLSSELINIYQRSCKNCHTIEATGAPLTGDASRWQAVLEKGMDAVLENVMNGYGGMPPFGQCFECKPEQFEQLILYMSNPGT